MRRQAYTGDGRSAGPLGYRPGGDAEILPVIWYILGLLVSGLAVGALGRLLHPGRDPMSVPVTIAVGVAATLVAGLVVRPLLGFGGGFVTAVVVAVLLVWLISRSRASS
jgi:uncharacterized membrane protein YeaQ/YmgE (transglycosylase-associated protein family)